MLKRISKRAAAEEKLENTYMIKFYNMHKQLDGKTQTQTPGRLLTGRDKQTESQIETHHQGHLLQGKETSRQTHIDRDQ